MRTSRLAPPSAPPGASWEGPVRPGSCDPTTNQDVEASARPERVQASGRGLLKRGPAAGIAQGQLGENGEALPISIRAYVMDKRTMSSYYGIIVVVAA